MKPFRAPKETLGNLGAEVAATVIAAAADVALIVDTEGVIRDVAFDSEELAREGYETWSGQRWTATVTPESRPKVEAMLREAAAKATPRRRHVNHIAPGGPDVPILYTAVQVGPKGRVVAVGRDLRPIAALQQKLVDAQQAMERDYARLRQLETRYRLLFQMSVEAVLIVDANTQRIIEANPAAGQLLGKAARRLIGRGFPDGFDPDGTAAIHALLMRVRSMGRGEDVRVRLAGGQRDFLVSASLVRQDTTSLFLVRLSPAVTESPGLLVPNNRLALIKIIESVPEGFVVTNLDGRITMANPAFLDLVSLPTEDQVRGESLERWLGRPGVDLNVLSANLREHGSVRLFATTLRDEYGNTTDVEVSAVQVLKVEDPCFGFTIRNVGRRPTAEARGMRELPRSVEQLTELVGRVSLKDLVRETTDVIERLCIEAALELTNDNRASAAEILGLSRQSLYTKLRRYGMGEPGPEADKEP